MYIYVCVCVYTFPLEPPSPLSPHHTPLGHHRAPGLAPCAIKQLPTSYLTDDSVCVYIYISATFSIHPTLSPLLFFFLFAAL